MKYKIVVLLILVPFFIFANNTKKLQLKTGKIIQEKELYSALGIKTPTWYEFWKDTNPNISPKIIPSLYESLGFFYKSEGFYHTKFKKIDTNESVKFIIDEGEPCYVKNITIDSDYNIKSLITLKVKKRFRSSEFKEIKKEIKKLMLKEGFCNFNLDAKARVDIKLNQVDLIYKLKKGKPCKFGTITINAPKSIDKKVIKSRLKFKTGDKFSSQKIKRSYSTLSGLEAFDGISLDTNKQGSTIDIYTKLREKVKTNRIEFGLGYETNMGPRTLLRYQKRNFKGDAKKLGFDLKYSKNEKFVKNSIYWPAAINLPYSTQSYYLDIKNELSYQKIKFDKFDEEKLSNYLHILKDFNIFSIDLGIAYENIKINKKGDACQISDGEFNLLFPFLKASFDFRDSKINPKNGIYLSQYLEGGLKFLKGSSTYSKSLTEARVISTYNYLTVAAKVKLGLIKEFDNSLPESKLFFAGGSFSNRGYSYNTLGSFDSNCEKLGGKTLIDTTIEMSYPIYKKLDLALFWDSTLLSMGENRFSINFVHSIGTGIRYNSPIGPIKFDFGVDVDNPAQRAIHFQIGQSF